nr:hypothetical protein CFP56_07667 [Quercus suber]
MPARRTNGSRSTSTFHGDRIRGKESTRERSWLAIVRADPARPPAEKRSFVSASESMPSMVNPSRVMYAPSGAWRRPCLATSSGPRHTASALAWGPGSPTQSSIVAWTSQASRPGHDTTLNISRTSTCSHSLTSVSDHQDGRVVIPGIDQGSRIQASGTVIQMTCCVTLNCSIRPSFVRRVGLLPKLTGYFQGSMYDQTQQQAHPADTFVTPSLRRVHVAF